MAGFFETHRQTLDQALKAIETRGYWSPYPEVPSGRIYGETAAAEGEAVFKARLDRPFDLPGHPGEAGGVGAERSPYGIALGITYPQAEAGALVAAAQAAGGGWAAASVADRVGVCLEALTRLNRRSFEIAHAVMHTTGQAFMMAFQAGGTHAQDRGLEAVAYAYAEMARVPGAVLWEKPQGKQEPLKLDKRFRIVPRGVALLVACSTFPTWNGYPGLFASLATGNTVVVKPHPGAILPLAISVAVLREVLAEAGFDPNCVLLAADSAEAPITRDLATHPAVRIIDYTGGPVFGAWLEENAAGRQIYTEKAGVNPVVIDSTDDFKGLCRNLAFSLSLYSGQMCTAPQNLFVPRGGIATDQGHKSFDEVAAGLAEATAKLLGDPARAAAILGAIQNPATLARVESAPSLGTVVLASQPVAHEGYPEARSVTPTILAVDAAAEDVYLEERFGPISFLVATEDSADSLRRAAQSVTRKGAITAAIYATDDAVLQQAEDAFAAAGVSLSENLTGGIHVNQSAAFSDYHVSGANPAGNACLTDSAYVANRFRVVAVRRPAAA